MNERLKELAAEHFNVRNGVIVSPVDGYTDIEQELQMFAQSIIKDCLIIMTSEEYNMTMLTCNPMVSGAINDAKWKIKEHFGEK